MYLYYHQLTPIIVIIIISSSHGSRAFLVIFKLITTSRVCHCLHRYYVCWIIVNFCHLADILGNAACLLSV